MYEVVATCWKPIEKINKKSGKIINISSNHQIRKNIKKLFLK